MKNRGFTLIELLGVIMILGILALITFPPILDQIRKSKQEIKNSTKILITDAAKDYYEDNTNNYEKIEGMTYCIDIKTLTDNGYLNKKIKDENINDISNIQKVKMIYHNNKFEYDVVNSCTKYTVTFDANGGTVDVESKEVTQDSVYGELPTPTREGYSFLGWNGKNMFNSEQAKFGYISDADGVLKAMQNGINSSDFIEIKADTDYTISPIISSGKWGAFYDQNKNYISGFTYTNGVVHSPSTAKYIRFTVNYSNSNDSYETTTQFEEGSIATEYEPYYITSETKVTRNYDHTLKAIWKENE